MGLSEDARHELSILIGEESAQSVIRNFDDPKTYPNDFLQELEFFMAKLIGESAAQKKVMPLYIKYKISIPVNKTLAITA